MQIDRENVILDTIKLAEDGSGEMILRFYEAKEAAVTADVQKILVDGRHIPVI